MNTSVGEYDPSDTPSGFLRWSRPASDEPSRVRRLSRGLKATTKRYPAHHLVTWALLLGLPLALLLWYIWTFRTIAYRLPWVLEISIESMAMEEHVWCGMISLYPGLQYCARGTIDLRVRNRLWVDLTVVGADVELDALLVTISQINHRFDGSVTIGGPIDVNAMSESVFPSPAVLLAHPYTRNSACKVSDHSIKVELHALGYYFGSWIYVGGVQFPPNHHQDEPANTLSNHEVVETTPTAIGNDLHWR